jgi:hypothetical protein
VLPTVYSFIARDHSAAADSERSKITIDEPGVAHA